MSDPIPDVTPPAADADGISGGLVLLVLVAGAAIAWWLWRKPAAAVNPGSSLQNNFNPDVPVGPDGGTSFDPTLGGSGI